MGKKMTTIKFKSDGTVMQVNERWANQFIKDGLAEEYTINFKSSPFPISEEEAFIADPTEFQNLRVKVQCVRLVIEEIRKSPSKDSIIQELKEELANGLEVGLENALHDSCFDKYKTDEEAKEEDNNDFLEREHKRIELAMIRRF